MNITEPHGFSLGVAAMPPDTTNNLHFHYTAEVFMIYNGTWMFRWGADGKDGEIIGKAADVASVPTWIFGGFINAGNDDGWIFTALGGDDTGGIIWHPRSCAPRRSMGSITRENMLVDTEAGAPPPPPERLIQPLDETTMAEMRRFDAHAMRSRVVARDWSSRALFDSVLPGHGSAIAPVIGHGMSEEREQAPKITNPHGFSMEWPRIQAGEQVGPFSLADISIVEFDNVAETGRSNYELTTFFQDPIRMRGRLSSWYSAASRRRADPFHRLGGLRATGLRGSMRKYRLNSLRITQSACKRIVETPSMHSNAPFRYREAHQKPARRGIADA